MSDQPRGNGSDKRRQPSEVLAASIIIPTLNEEKYLPVLLDSLRRVSAPMEIIVVDGNSTDRTVHVVEEYKPFFTGNASLRLLHSKERNISLQRNAGAAAATHDILIFCDADILIPSHESYAKLISQFTEERMAVAAPVVVPIEPGLRLKLTFKVIYYLQRMLLRFWERPYFGGYYLMTTRAVFLTVGGFDTNLLLAEDVDYSLRAAQLGPYRLMDVTIAVSARRLITYGYWWVVKALPSIIRFIRTGHIAPESVDYPFGEYNVKFTAHSGRRRRLFRRANTVSDLRQRQSESPWPNCSGRNG